MNEVRSEQSVQLPPKPPGCTCSAWNMGHSHGCPAALESPAAAERLLQLQRVYGCIPGIGADLNRDVSLLLADRQATRLAATNFLRRLDKMGGTVTEGHSRKCNVWKGGQCGCSIAQHIRALQEAVGYGA